MDSLLTYLGQFADKAQRQEAANKLARQLHAEELIVFIQDEELNIMLPGAGFSQTLANGRYWKKFLHQLPADFQGELPFDETVGSAISVRHNQSLAVLIGGKPTDNDLMCLQKILAIVGPLLQEEHRTLTANSKAKLNATLAEKSERLASMLDAIRINLMEALEENAQLLKITKQQNAELAAANQELKESHQKVMTGVEELNQANKRLRAINADLDNFIYSASHDLKAPVVNIEGLMGLLTDRLSPELLKSHKADKIVAMINTSVQRFKATIQDLTEVIKIEKEEPAKPESINLPSLLEEIKEDLTLPILETRTRICLQHEAGTQLVFSRKNLKSILYNLISNAIKYRDPEKLPQVTIRLKEKNGFSILSITDNGLGLDSRQKDQIFGLFKRLHAHVEGAGVGLYIVKKIIDNAGGKIEVESAPGKGTTFHVYLKKHSSLPVSA